MSVFYIRKSVPILTDKYISFYNNEYNNGINTCITGQNASGASYSQANVLPNCVGWANARFNEIYSQVNNLPSTYMQYPYFNNDAGGFYKRAKRLYTNLKTSTNYLYPRVGAIMVLSTDPNAISNEAAPGHVLIVEEIVNNTIIFVSESGWRNELPALFRQWHRRDDLHMWDNPGNWYGANGYRFVGFIYNPAITGEEIPETMPESSIATLSDIKVQGI